MEIKDAVNQIPKLKDIGLSNLDISPLEGGLSNHNYLVKNQGETYVLRIPGQSVSELVDRKVEKINATIASDHKINAEILFFDGDSGLQLCRFLDSAATLSPNTAKDQGAIQRVAKSFSVIHNSKNLFEGVFSPPAEARRYIDLMAKHDIAMPAGFEAEKQRMGKLMKKLESLKVPKVSCHCDPLPENFLDDGNKVFIIDWEYSGLNDPMWDLGTYSCECGFNDDQNNLFLNTYFGKEPTEEQRFRFISYRVLCDFIWSMWGLYQGKTSGNADFDFAAYSNNRYQRYLSRASN